MSASRELLCAYFEGDGVRYAFDLRSGVHVEGYPLEVEHDRVLFAYGGPLAPDEPEWIAFDAISPEGLGYWVEAQSRWVDFVPPRG